VRRTACVAYPRSTPQPPSRHTQRGDQSSLPRAATPVNAANKADKSRPHEQTAASSLLGRERPLPPATRAQSCRRSRSAQRTESARTAAQASPPRCTLPVAARINRETDRQTDRQTTRTTKNNERTMSWIRAIMIDVGRAFGSAS
jgi:hypothetical protein